MRARFLVRLLSPILSVCLSLGVLGPIRSARASGPVDLDANSAILERLQRTLPGLGLGDLHLVGGAALSLAMGARHGAPLGWNDLDVRGISTGKLDQARMERIAEQLTRDGEFQLLAPGVMEFLIHHERDVERLHSQGFGMRMQTRGGLRFDLAVLRDPSQLPRSGYNSAESLIVPLKGEHDLRKVLGRLATGPANDVIARGDLVEVHGQAAAVLEGKVVLTNTHNLRVEPELAALRLLRAVEKVSRQGVQKVDAQRDLGMLQRRMPKLLASAPQVTDPSYAPRVQEQATALLRTGGPGLAALAHSMKLDLAALSRGEIQRRTAGPRAVRSRAR